MRPEDVRLGPAVYHICEVLGIPPHEVKHARANGCLWDKMADYDGQRWGQMLGITSDGQTLILQCGPDEDLHYVASFRPWNAP
jgi:hypothetical protein